MLIQSDTVMQWRRHHEAFVGPAILALDALPLTQRIPLIRTPRESFKLHVPSLAHYRPAQFDASLINQIELCLVPLEENKSAYQVNARQDARLPIP